MGWNDNIDDDELGNLPSEAFDTFNVDGPFDPNDSWLSTANNDEQLIAMRAWFHAHYCDPAHETPYNGREGGYLFIYGGPFDPAEVLPERFSGIVDDEIIQVVIDEMYEEVGDQWAPIQYTMPDEEIEMYWRRTSTEQLETFQSHLENVDNLLEYQLEERIKFSLLVMLYAHIVAATEQFLSAVFIREVTNSDKLTRKLIETDPVFGDRTFTLKEIYRQNETLKNTVSSYLRDLIFHDLKKIKPMYKSVLGFDFGDISWLFHAVIKRHDCVHRAGFDKEGNRITVTTEEIKELMLRCNELVRNIDLHVIHNNV